MSPNESSLIIPAYRDHTELATCLAAVARLDPPPGEVIIVVDGNNQPVMDRARGYGFKTIMLTGAPGVAAARNAGAHAATGRLLLFTDSDIEVPVSFVAQAVRIFADAPEFAAAIGSYDDQPSAPGMISSYRNLLHHFTHQTAHTDAQTFWGGCGAIVRDAFDSAGGFDERYHKPSVEDIELGYRLKQKGWRIRLDPTWQVKHLKNWTLASMIHTDLFRRAIPWSQLLVREKRMDNDLNIDTSSRISGLLVVLLFASLAGRWFFPFLDAVLLMSLAGIAILNRRFFVFLMNRGGVKLVVSGYLLHLVYLSCAVNGFVIGRLTGQRKSTTPAAS